MTQPAIKYDVFQAIADPTRRNVLQLLAASDRPISNISEHFEISRTAVVKHLKILEQAELISAQKKGAKKSIRCIVSALRRLKTGSNTSIYFGTINWLGFKAWLKIIKARRSCLFIRQLLI